MFSTHYLTLEKVKINRKFPLPGPPKTDTLPPPSSRPRPQRSSPFPMAVPWRTLSGMLEYTDRLGTPGTSEAETGSSQRLPEKARPACMRSHADSAGHVSGRREGARGHVGSRGRPRRVEPRPLTLSSCRPRSGFGANRVHSWASHPGTHSSAPSAGRGHLLVPRSSPRASPAVEDTRTSHLLWPSSQWPVAAEQQGDLRCVGGVPEMAFCRWDSHPWQRSGKGPNLLSRKCRRPLPCPDSGK